MKTCPHCGRTCPDAQLACQACGARLPDGEAARREALAHINYLLGELPRWVVNGWVAPTQARQLHDEYQRRRILLLYPKGAPQTAEARPPIETLPSPAPTSDGPPEPTRPGPLAAFLEEQNISYAYVVGALLLLAGVAAIVRWTWGSIGRSLVFALMLALTGGLWALGRSRGVQGHRITAAALTAIAALLVPLDIVALNAFRLLPSLLSAQSVGLLTSALCLPLYAWLARTQTPRSFAIFLILDLTALIHFALQAILPDLLHTHDPTRLLAAYGVAYVPLASLYLLAAHRAGPGERRAVWLTAAHVTVLAAALLALLTGGGSAFGNLALTLLLAAGLYGAAAWLLDGPEFASLSAVLLTIGAALVLYRAGYGWAARWYVYALLCQTLGILFWGLARVVRTQERERLAGAYRDAAQFTAGLAVVFQLVRVAAALPDFPALNFPTLELWGALLCASLSFAFYAIERLFAVSDGAWTLVVCLAGLLLARYAPASFLWHQQPHMGIPLVAAAAGLLWSLHRRRPALLVFGLSLFACTLYALQGGFYATTMTALLLLIVFLIFDLLRTRQPVRLERQGEVCGAVAASAVFVLLWQSRLLPLLHARFGWEPNFGEGFFALALLCLGLSALSRRSRDGQDPIGPTLLTAGQALGVVTVVLQFGYAYSGGFPYSPLLMLASATAIAAVVSLARRSSWAACWAVALAVCAEVVFWLGPLAGPSTAGRELVLTVFLLVAGALFVLLARQQRQSFLTCVAVFSAALGLVHGLHSAFDPAVTVYTLALLPFVASLYALGFWLTRRDTALWREPLLACALLLSLLALVPVGAQFLEPAHSAAGARALWALAGYGALFVVVAAFERGRLYLCLAAGAWDGGYLLALLRHHPALPQPLLGFLFGLAALLWLAGAAGRQRAALEGQFPAAVFFRVAVAVAFVSVGIALSGMGGEFDRYGVYALLVAGTVFLGYAWGQGQPGWQHAGVCAYLLAYFAFLSRRLGTPGLATSDFYLIPIGLYVLALGLLSRRRTPDATNRQPFYLAGLLLVLTPTYLAARQAHAAPVHSLLLATECVVAIFFGISARIKLLVTGGTAFLLLLVGLQFQGYLTHLHWAVYAMLLGLAIIGGALYFEKRRDEILRWTQDVQERLKDWE